MKILSNGKTYLVKRGPSIYTNRVGLDDCVISVCTNDYGKGGWVDSNGLICRSIKRIACENGAILRDHEFVPEELSIPYLKQMGYIDDN